MVKTGERVICRFHLAFNDDSKSTASQNQRRNRVVVVRYFPYIG